MKFFFKSIGNVFHCFPPLCLITKKMV